MLENKGDKTAKQSRKQRASRKEAARISRREHEAEDWAQAQLLGLEKGTMPENTAGLKYLAHHYPWLLTVSKGYDRKNPQKTPQNALTDARTITGREGLQPSTNTPADSLLSAAIEPTELQDINKQSSNIFGLGQVDSVEDDMHGSIAHIAATNFGESLATTKPIDSFHSSYAAVLTSKTRSTSLPRVSTHKLPIPQRASGRVCQSYELNHTVTSHLANKPPDVFDNSSISLLKSMDLKQKDFAALPRSERLKILTLATNLRIGRLLRERDARKSKSPVAHLKKVETDANGTSSSPQPSQHDSTAVIDTIDTYGVVQRPVDTRTHNPVFSQMSRSQNLSTNASDVVTDHGSLLPGLEATEVKSKAINKPVPVVDLPPAKRDLRVVPEKTNALAVRPRYETYSTHSQSLRATAPIFVPRDSANDSRTSFEQIHLDSIRVAPSLTDTIGSQLYDAITRPQTASTTTTNSKVEPTKYLPEPGFVPEGHLDHGMDQKPAILRQQYPVRSPAYNRRLSREPVASVKIQTGVADTSYISSPEKNTVHKARAILALETTRCAVGLTEEQILSYMATGVSPFEQVDSSPGGKNEINDKSERPQKSQVSRFFSSSTQVDKQSRVDKPSTSAVDKKENQMFKSKAEINPAWQARDFQGFRVPLGEIKLVDEGHDWLALAQEARIPLYRAGMETEAKTGQEGSQQQKKFFRNRRRRVQNTVNERLPHTFNAQGYEMDLTLESCNLADATGLAGIEKYDQNIDTSRKIPRDYKELAAMSDIDSLASEEGEHIGNEFFVTERTQRAREKQALATKSKLNAATASFTSLQPADFQGSAPSGVSPEHDHHLRQVPSLDQRQSPQHLVLGGAFQAPQPPPMQFSPYLWPPQESPYQSHYQYQLPQRHDWELEWQHGIPTGPYFQTVYPAAPMYPMNEQRMGISWQGYAEQLRGTQQQNVERRNLRYLWEGGGI